VFLALPHQAFAEEVVFDRILVKINDDIITQYDLDEEMKPILAKIGEIHLTAAEQEQMVKLRKQMLERMVSNKLMAQEIKKFEINVSENVVDNELAKFKQERGLTDKEFHETLKHDEMTLDEFRSKLKNAIEKQELLSFMVHSKVLVTDSEIQAEYEAKHDEYVLGKLVSLSIIMLPENISAQEVKKRIEEGELTFADAAKKYSIGPGKDKGGAIGDVNWSDLADDWKESIKGIQEGGVSRPLSIQGKSALLSPVKIVEDRLVPLEEVRESIFKRLMDEKRERIFDEYFDKLKESSVIVYMD